MFSATADDLAITTATYQAPLDPEKADVNTLIKILGQFLAILAEDAPKQEQTHRLRALIEFELNLIHEAVQRRVEAGTHSFLARIQMLLALKQEHPGEGDHNFYSLLSQIAGNEEAGEEDGKNLAIDTYNENSQQNLQVLQLLSILEPRFVCIMQAISRDHGSDQEAEAAHKELLEIHKALNGVLMLEAELNSLYPETDAAYYLKAASLSLRGHVINWINEHQGQEDALRPLLTRMQEIKQNLLYLDAYYQKLAQQEALNREVWQLTFELKQELLEKAVFYEYETTRSVNADLHQIFELIQAIDVAIIRFKNDQHKRLTQLLSTKLQEYSRDLLDALLTGLKTRNPISIREHNAYQALDNLALSLKQLFTLEAGVREICEDFDTWAGLSPKAAAFCRTNAQELNGIQACCIPAVCGYMATVLSVDKVIELDHCKPYQTLSNAYTSAEKTLRGQICFEQERGQVAALTKNELYKLERDTAVNTINKELDQDIARLDTSSGHELALHTAALKQHLVTKLQKHIADDQQCHKNVPIHRYQAFYQLEETKALLRLIESQEYTQQEKHKALEAYKAQFIPSDKKWSMRAKLSTSFVKAAKAFALGAVTGTGMGAAGGFIGGLFFAGIGAIPGVIAGGVLGGISLGFLSALTVLISNCRDLSPDEREQFTYHVVLNLAHSVYMRPEHCKTEVAAAAAATASLTSPFHDQAAAVANAASASAICLPADGISASTSFQCV